ncbi:hypothetical protein [Arthrobacter sp. B10-11]|uniref:hypothetical protein n=1 Tax=Arthrobacter sp. B10-11 TaxID=3081160 RepID=UPI0029542718|nr:hypothetical protein [Arthrobacter sp. B10-11]MDV8147853.1 hypothetical protein [Arthrobacter sp. B10-11]
MADIAAVLGRLSPEELDELREIGPQGHLTRRLVDALDRAAGGSGAGRGYYVPTGSVSATGGPHLVLRSDVSAWLFGANPQIPHGQQAASEAAGSAQPERDWSELRPGDKVAIVRGNRVTASGIVDAMTDDASTVWVLFEGVAPRRMFHRGDPDDLRPVR